jgi:hypothetical protein
MFIRKKHPVMMAWHHHKGKQAVSLLGKMKKCLLHNLGKLHIRQ